MLLFTLVLVIGTVIALTFKRTRPIGLLGVAVLAARYPALVFTYSLIASVLVYFLFVHH